jgi:hypothetical protein
MVVDGADAGGRPDEWPELWLYDREADITQARKLAEAQATWREYQPLLHALPWDDYNEAWLRRHRVTQERFCRPG